MLGKAHQLWGVYVCSAASGIALSWLRSRVSLSTPVPFLLGAVWYNVTLLSTVVACDIGMAIKVGGCVGVFRLSVAISSRVPGITVSTIPSLAHGHIALSDSSTSGLTAGLFVDGKKFLLDVF